MHLPRKKCKRNKIKREGFVKIYIWTLYSKLLISPLPVFKTPIFGFSSELIVSKSGEKAPNVVYKGKLRNNDLVVIKHFSKLSWPNPHQFVPEACGVGKVWHKRMVNLIKTPSVFTSPFTNMSPQRTTSIFFL